MGGSIVGESASLKGDALFQVMLLPQVGFEVESEIQDRGIAVVS